MSLKVPIYMDNNATTRLDPRVLERMMPYFTEVYGNAASRNHAYGWDAEEAVEKARIQVAEIIGARDSEIVFTSGATEANNLALKGTAEMLAEKGKHFITCETEHKAILDTCEHLEDRGWKVTRLKTDKKGRLTAQQVADAIQPDTVLISIMFANNELGTIHPIAEIGKVAKEAGIWFHTDATQAVGKVPVDVEAMGIDMLSLSGHKIYGPKGIGALYVRRRNPRVKLAPIIDGGRHERGMRSGTLNVPGIVGLGAALEIARQELPGEAVRLAAMRDRLEKGIMDQLEEVHINGDPEHRLPNVSNLSFAFVEGEALMMGIKDIAVSSGSACTSASLEPSYVLRAIGVGDDLAHSSIRYGLGRFTTEDEVDFTISETVKAVKKLRDMSPLYEMWKEGIDLSKVQWSSH